jgi:hypothetical protein
MVKVSNYFFFSFTLYEQQFVSIQIRVASNSYAMYVYVHSQLRLNE